jgi:hypothetical protein
MKAAEAERRAGMLRRIVRGRLSYANVMSTVAVFIALGGVSYAAVTLPRNSVGTTQLKKNAVTNVKLGANSVTSGKVRNGSLLAKDFRVGQLTAGLPGLKGDAGVKGDTGIQGPIGAAGPPGVSEYERVETVHNVVSGDTSIVMSASCPAGKKLLGGGGAVQDSKFHITFLLPQVNDVVGLTAVVIPGQVIYSSSQAFAVAICGKVG